MKIHFAYGQLGLMSIEKIISAGLKKVCGKRQIIPSSIKINTMLFYKNE
ncbi:MAG: hypothetical protein L6Q54_15685 [Leptospiraceae bacterium]|nr:hypothetical protein [Leptospiraceae bacterium]MCK6382677.1 hypothetical protein [Leptospiraceae bacterium]NUM42945.1 hypothetical protein [Leptospiraceae bacterium]